MPLENLKEQEDHQKNICNSTREMTFHELLDGHIRKRANELEQLKALQLALPIKMDYKAEQVLKRTFNF